jgi:hypothetical protein
MWIPSDGPQPLDEVCGLCGVCSGAHNQQPDPPEASLPCPEPWPEPNLSDEDFAALEAEAERKLTDAEQAWKAYQRERKRDEPDR